VKLAPKPGVVCFPDRVNDFLDLAKDVEWLYFRSPFITRLREVRLPRLWTGRFLQICLQGDVFLPQTGSGSCIRAASGTTATFDTS